MLLMLELQSLLGSLPTCRFMAGLLGRKRSSPQPQMVAGALTAMSKRGTQIRPDL